MSEKIHILETELVDKDNNTLLIHRGNVEYNIRPYDGDIEKVRF